MTTLTAHQVASITHAPSLDAALAMTGTIDPLNAHEVKLAYIRAVLGPRATSGYFVPTRRNVNRKFSTAWNEILRYRLEFHCGSSRLTRYASNLTEACQIMGAPTGRWLRILAHEIVELGHSEAYGWWTVSPMSDTHHTTTD